MQQASTWIFRAFAGFALICVAVSCFFLYRSLQKGIGVTPDSVDYLYAAQSFKNGQGLKSIYRSATQEAWLTHFPPALSILYGSVARTTAIKDVLQVAIAFNMAFFILNGMLVGLLTWAGTKNKWLALLAGLFMFTSIDGFCIAQMLWSEPCFLFFALVSLYCLSRYAAAGTMKLLLLTAGLTAIACTIRYAGATLLITGCLVVYTRPGLGRAGNLWRSFCFGAVGSSLLLLWFARNYLLQKTVGDRSLAFHPMTADYLHDFLHAIKSFFLQANTDQATGCIGALFTCILLFLIYRVYVPDSFIKAHALPRVLMLYAIVYILFIFTSNTFLDFTPLYYRILYLPFLCFLLVFIMRLAPGGGNLTGGRKAVLTAFCSILVLLHVVAFKNFVSSSPEPDGYLAVSWSKSETAGFVEQLPAEAVIYSPDPEAIYMLTGRTVASTKLIDQDYLLNRARRQFIVYFKSGRDCNGYSYNTPEHGKLEKIKLIGKFADGKVYEIF